MTSPPIRRLDRSPSGPEVPRPGGEADPSRAPRRLVTGPPGSGKSRLAVALFDEVVRAEGPDAALMVFPTYGQVEHAKRLAISRRGDRPDVRGLLDASYATFTSLNERLASGFRVRSLPSRRRRDRLADEALGRSDAPIFRAVRDRPGFRSRFLRLVKELKQTGEPPASLIERARTAATALEAGSRERWLAFLSGWERYEALLVETESPDHEDVLRASLEAAAQTTSRLSGVRLLVFDGFDDFSGVEARLLEAAAEAVTAHAGRVVVTLPYDDARAELFPSSAALRTRLVERRGFVEQRLHGFPRSDDAALSTVAGRLFAPPVPRAAAPADPTSVVALVGADPVDEWDRVGREIRRLAGAGRGFRDIGVIVRRLDGAATVGRRVLEGLGIPVRLIGGGEALSTEPVVRAMRGPLDLLAGDDGRDERDFDGHALLDYLRWLALDSGEPLDLDAVDAADLRWRETRFPATWAEVLADLEAHAAETLLPAARRLEVLRALAEASASPFDVLERAIAECLPLRRPAVLDADGRPTDREADARLSRARAAKRRLLALVEEGRGSPAGGLPCPSMREAVDALRLAAADASCEPADRRLDAVSVMDAEEARHWELPVVFVVGLVEKGFPLHPREDLFLRDEDREALSRRLDEDRAGASVPWRTAREAEVGERRLFFTAVTRARQRLYVSRAARDESGRERARSFFWRDLATALGLEGEDVERFGARPRRPRSIGSTPGGRRDRGRPSAARRGGGPRRRGDRVVGLRDRELARARREIPARRGRSAPGVHDAVVSPGDRIAVSVLDPDRARLPAPLLPRPRRDASPATRPRCAAPPPIDADSAPGSIARSSWP